MGRNARYYHLSEQRHPDCTAPPAVSGLRCDGGVDTGDHAHGSGRDDCRVHVENLGGITDATLTIQRGISILVGRNATNRSSFLRSLAAGLGGDDAAAHLKTDTDAGHVELTIGTETYTRSYERTGTGTRSGGTPYTDDPELVDTFVALFADSPARRAVEDGDSLREILMRPVDTAEIQARIDELKRERSELDETIQHAESRKSELPALEAERTRLEDDLSEVESEIAELESVVESVESTEESSSETERLRSELESLRGQLQTAERRRDETEQQLEFRREERAELVAERERLETELEEFEEPETLETEVSQLGTEIDRLTDQRARLEQAVEDLQSVVQVNETFLDGDTEVVGLTDDQPVTDALGPGSRAVECWTCGTEVERATIDERIGTLRELVAQQRAEINEMDDRLAELEDRKATQERRVEEYRETVRERRELEDRIAKHSDRIEELESEYESQQAEIDRLEEEITAVEAEIAESESEDDDSDEFITAHEELTELERERGRLENQLDEVNRKIEEIEGLEADRETATERRTEVADELEALRGRIDRLEGELVETLNSMMDDLLGRLGYDNIARVWIERKTADGTTESSFDLHIVRETADGSMYEDSVETLSESEREVLGVVVALAGYLVHDIDKQVPFLLLDSVEMIDGERLAHLLDYIDAETEIDFLSVALLPKDAQSVEDADVLEEYTTIDFESTTT